MSGAIPENPPPPRVTRLLELAAAVVSARDALTTSRDALLAAPTRSPALAEFADAIDGEARGLAEFLSGVYRLVELAEDSWDDLDGPHPLPAPERGRLRESLDRAVDNAFTDLARLTGMHPAPRPGEARAGTVVGHHAASTVVGHLATDASHPDGASPDSASPECARPDNTSPDCTGIDTRATVEAWARAEPSEVYSTVEHMSTADRRVLALAEPEIVGGTYGVPWEVRARANAVAVRRALHREQLAGTPWSPRIGRLETMARRAGRRRRSFLAFSPRRGGRMIEVVGEPGPGTDAIAVYVPGTGTNLDMSHVNTDVVEDLVEAGGGRLVAVAYLDGEFPQDIMADAGRPHFAEAMAPRLVRFCREVDRVMEIECPGAALTVLGHSYGGRIVGTAERLGLRADRVVYAESPDLGVGVAGPADWRSPGPVRRFSFTAPGDPVELLQVRFGLRRGWSVSDLSDGAVRLDTGYFADAGRRADDDNDDDNNGHSRPDLVYGVADNPVRPELVYGTRGHGGVFDRDCGAFRAMLAVMLGGPAPLWREREIRARHTGVRRGEEGRMLPVIRRHVAGLWLRRADEPYAEPEVLWEAPERIIEIPAPRATDVPGQSRK